MSNEEYKLYCYSFRNNTLQPRKNNSKLSNKSFKDKRDMDKYGYKFSKMPINQHLATYDNFGKVEMKDWGLYLFKKALKIWSFEEDTQQIRLM